jgi:superfamily II DNA helicase RecQ
MATSQSLQTLNATATTQQEKAVETTTTATVQAMMDAGSQMLRLRERIGDNSHDNPIVNCKERRNARTQIHDLIVVVKLFFQQQFFFTTKRDKFCLIVCLSRKQLESLASTLHSPKICMISSSPRTTTNEGFVFNSGTGLLQP